MAIYGTLGGQDSTTTGYPSIQPTLDLNFAKTKALDPRITFYRNSLGTYVDDKGIIRTVPENVPRFDHDSTTGESLGLLIEEGRTNLRTNSDTGGFHPVIGSWTSTGTSTDITAPNGSSTTYKVVSSGGGQSSIDIGYGQIGLSSGVTYTVSAYYYATGSTTASRTIGIAIFGNGTSGTGSIILPQNQWVRRTFTFTATTTTASGQIRIIDNDTSGFNTTNGAIIYLWGAQVEAGSFPTSYIPTSGSTVTRSADFVEMSGTNFSSWYNPIESTFYTNYIMNSLDGAYNNPSFYAYSDNQNYLAIFGYNPAYAWAQASNATAAGISLGGTTTTNVDYKVSFGVKVNDFAASINGSAVSTDASGNVPVVNQMFIGKRVEVSNAHLNGTLKRLTYYPKRLTNTQLQNLTA